MAADYVWYHNGGTNNTLDVTAAKGTSAASTYSGYSISYAGATYSTAIKMESATTLTFTTTKAANIIVGVALKNGNTYDASKTALSLTTGTANPVTANTGITTSTSGASTENGLSVIFSNVSAGTQVIKRAGSELGVFYIKVAEVDNSKVSEPMISAQLGANYGEASTVTITCTTADATIYYTTDGNDPTVNSNVYSEPFTVSQACTVKAIAIKDGLTNSDIASKAVTINDQRKINFDFSGVTVTGKTVENTTTSNNATYTLPYGRMYYIAGKTQTAWNDGTQDYALGATITVDKDYTFSPVFADNTVALGAEEVTVNWTFATSEGAPSIGIEGNEGDYATQVTINSKKLDVVMHINARQDAGIEGAKGKWNTTSANNRAQVNKGTVFTIPAISGMVVTVTITNGTAATDMFSFAGEEGTADTQAKTVSYTYNGTASTIDIIDLGKNTYPAGISVVYPASTSIETPVISAQPASKEYAWGTTTFDALSVTATVTEGELSYQWYNEEGAIEGATAATYTPTAVGTYYVIVTNTVGEETATKQSDDAVISTAAYVPVSSISLEASVTEIKYGETFTVTATVGPENATRKVIYWTSEISNNKEVFEFVSEDEHANPMTVKAVVPVSSKKIYADANGPKGSSESEKNKNVSIKVYMLVEFDEEGVEEMKYYGTGLNLPTPEKEGFIFKGWYDNAELTGDAVKATNYKPTDNVGLYAKWEIDNKLAATGAAAWETMTEDYNQSMFKSNDRLITKTAFGKHGTICLPYNATVTGAVIYEFSERNAEGLVFDYAEGDAESSIHVEAGKAYIYFAIDNEQSWELNDSDPAVAVETGNLLEGTYADITLANGEYFFYTADECFHPAGNNVVLPAFRACIPNMLEFNGAPVRLIMPKTGVATSVENAADYKATKAMVDGKIVILRGAKSYNVAGQAL